MDKSEPQDTERRLPEIDFGTFILSLAETALVHMGETQAEGEAPAVNLALARQTIDIISMLREKTRGNLSAEEQRALDSVIYDLRLRFVNRRKAAQP